MNRAAFLIERASVPRYYPLTYCAEMGQIFAAIEQRLARQQPGGDSDAPG